MAKSKKEKKDSRRERREKLKAVSERIHHKVVLEEQRARELGYDENENVQYIYSSDDEEGANVAPEANPGSSILADLLKTDRNNTTNVDGGEEDRVHLPSMDSNDQVTHKARLPSRKYTKMSWEELKIAVSDKYGPEVVALIDEHDGNAADPLFTVFMKTIRHTVPVPRHWSLLRSFLSNQTDRSKAVDLVPPEIAALGVHDIRASRDKKASVNQISFLLCFMSGTPLQRKKFNRHLTSFGDVFHENKWIPKGRFKPGVISQQLRAALGMGPNYPPPWLHAMQAMRRTPPAYPQLRIPGLNAPIPPGAQWGNGEGQWGQPPRNKDNSFLFPGVMDEAASRSDAPTLLWGTVPPFSIDESSERIAQSPPPTSTRTANVEAPKVSASLPAATTTPASTKKINPVPFNPQQYIPNMNSNIVAPVNQEYVRVQDSAAGATVALGSLLVPKQDALASSSSAPKTNPAKQPLAQPPKPTKF